eukprot:scaffold82354_cov17-Tisochrysis_lutea.AAC.1
MRSRQVAQQGAQQRYRADCNIERQCSDIDCSPSSAPCVLPLVYFPAHASSVNCVATHVLSTLKGDRGTLPGPKHCAGCQTLFF